MSLRIIQVARAHEGMDKICEKVENRAIREVLLALTRCAHMFYKEAFYTIKPHHNQDKLSAAMKQVQIFIMYGHTFISSETNEEVFRMIDELYEANKDCFTELEQEQMEKIRQLDGAYGL